MKSAESLWVYLGAEYAHNATTTIPGNGNALTKKMENDDDI